MKSTSYAWLLAAAIGFVLASTAAYADKTKTCTVDVTPPNASAGFGQENTQTSACTSNSDTGLVEGDVTNSQGHTVPGKN